MKHLLYLSLLLVAAVVVIFGASTMLEQQALRQRDVRIEQPTQPVQPAQAARAAGTPASSKSPGRNTAARTAMDDGL